MTDRSTAAVGAVRRVEPLGGVSFWLAILSLLFGLGSVGPHILAITGIPSLVAAGLGGIGARRAIRAPNRWRGAWVGIVGAIIGTIGVVLAGWMVVDFLRHGNWGISVHPATVPFRSLVAGDRGTIKGEFLGSANAMNAALQLS